MTSTDERNEMTARYEVKCDDCKATLRRTDSLAESAAGGRCDGCRGETPEHRFTITHPVTGDQAEADDVGGAKAAGRQLRRDAIDAAGASPRIHCLVVDHEAKRICERGGRSLAGGC